jgi:ribosome biogenesis GTPase
MGWKLNRYESQLCKKAMAKKERAKAKHFWNLLNWENYSWEEVDFKPSKQNIEWIVSFVSWNTFSILNMSKQKEVKWDIDKKLPKELLNQLVVWDKVYYEIVNWVWIVKQREERNSFIARMRWDSTRFWTEEEHILAANVDTALIVAPVKNPEFHSNLVDRYLIVCQNWWVEPVICLNKVDLTDERNQMIKWYKNSWIKVIEVSTINWVWIDEIKEILNWKIGVLIWKSGVWKSSIINKISPWIDLKTWEVNTKSWEWRHTTTASELYSIWENSYIIDTPWIRALWLGNISKNDLKLYFPEFEEFAVNCKYKDCIHSHEPECWVKVAVQEWRISQGRYDSYLRILNDLVD